MKKLIYASVLALSAGPVFADGHACDGNICSMATIVGYNCSFAAVTNAADTWDVTLAYDAKGSDVIGTQSGSGENDTPMKWITGTALWNTTGDMIYMIYTANGSSDVQMNHGGGSNPGVQAQLMNGEDGGDGDFNDVIANLTCMQASPLG